MNRSCVVVYVHPLLLLKTPQLTSWVRRPPTRVHHLHPTPDLTLLTSSRLRHSTPLSLRPSVAEFLPGGVGVRDLKAMGYEEPTNIKIETDWWVPDVYDLPTWA